MKKLFIVLSISLLAFSCKEETVNTWDDLTDAQKQEILARAAQKCKTDYRATYDEFKTTSLNNTFLSSNYDRRSSSSSSSNRGFYYERKKGSETDARLKADIRIWKRDANNRDLYFYVTETVNGTSSYFLKIDDVTNDAMIESLYVAHCSASESIKSTTDNDGPLKMVLKHVINNTPNQDQYTDTYQYLFTELAYFGQYRLSRNIKTVVIESGATVGTAVDYKSSISTKNYSDFTTTNYTTLTQKFCTLKETSPGVYNPTTANGEVFGYELNCVTALPGDWNLTI